MVDVLYDAADPKTAYLASPSGAGAVILIIYGSVFLVAALGTAAIMLASACARQTTAEACWPLEKETAPGRRSEVGRLDDPRGHDPTRRG